MQCIDNGLYAPYCPTQLKSTAQISALSLKESHLTAHFDFSARLHIYIVNVLIYSSFIEEMSLTVSVQFNFWHHHSIFPPNYLQLAYYSYRKRGLKFRPVVETISKRTKDRSTIYSGAFYNAILQSQSLICLPSYSKCILPAQIN